MKTVILNAIRPVRRQLLKAALSGQHKLKVIGKGKEWYGAVETENRVVRFTSKYGKLKDAIAQLTDKYGITPKQYRQAA